MGCVEGICAFADKESGILGDDLKREYARRYVEHILANILCRCAKIKGNSRDGKALRKLVVGTMDVVPRDCGSCSRLRGCRAKGPGRDVTAAEVDSSFEVRHGLAVRLRDCHAGSWMAFLIPAGQNIIDYYCGDLVSFYHENMAVVLRKVLGLCGWRACESCKVKGCILAERVGDVSDLVSQLCLALCKDLGVSDNVWTYEILTSLFLYVAGPCERRLNPKVYKKVISLVDDISRVDVDGGRGIDVFIRQFFEMEDRSLDWEVLVRVLSGARQIWMVHNGQEGRSALSTMSDVLYARRTLRMLMGCASECDLNAKCNAGLNLAAVVR